MDIPFLAATIYGDLCSKEILESLLLLSQPLENTEERGALVI